MPALIALLLAATPLFDDARAPLPSEPDSEPAQCGACHTEELAQWSHSVHAVSATNAIYRASHALEPMQWCDNCHRPQPEGVSCAACHVRDSVVLSSRAPTAAGQRAHRMRLEPELGASELCGECHQFNFPQGRAEPVVPSRHRMQRTLDEWRASGSTRSCQSCHPAHDPRGAHDVLALRAALDADVSVSRAEVHLRLKPVGVAHHFPTGDPFRRLRIELCADSLCNEVLATRELGRELAAVGDSWRIAEDFTLPPEGLTVEMPAPPRARFLRVTYRYAARSSELALDPSLRETPLFTRSIPTGGSP